MDRRQVDEYVTVLFTSVAVHPLKLAFKNPLTDLLHYLQLLESAVAQNASAYAAGQSVENAFSLLTTGLADALVELDTILRRPSVSHHAARDDDDYDSLYATPSDSFNLSPTSEANERVAQLVDILTHHASVIYFLGQALYQRPRLDASFRSQLNVVRQSLQDVCDRFFAGQHPAVTDAQCPPSAAEGSKDDAALLLNTMSRLEINAVRHMTDASRKCTWVIGHAIFWLGSARLQHNAQQQPPMGPWHKRSQSEHAQNSPKSPVTSDISPDILVLAYLIKSAWLVLMVDSIEGSSTEEESTLPDEIHDLVSLLRSEILTDLKHLYYNVPINLDYTDLIDEVSTIFRLALPWEGKPDFQRDVSTQSGYFNSITSSAIPLKSDISSTQGPEITTLNRPPHRAPYVAIELSNDGGDRIRSSIRASSILSNTTHSTAGGVALPSSSSVTSSRHAITRIPLASSAPASSQYTEPRTYMHENLKGRSEALRNQEYRDSAALRAGMKHIPINLADGFNSALSREHHRPPTSAQATGALPPLDDTDFVFPFLRHARQGQAESHTSSDSSERPSGAGQSVTSNLLKRVPRVSARGQAVSGQQELDLNFLDSKQNDTSRLKEQRQPVRGNARSAVARQKAHKIAVSPPKDRDTKRKAKQVINTHDLEPIGPPSRTISHQLGVRQTSAPSHGGSRQSATGISDSSSTNSRSSAQMAATAMTSTSFNRNDSQGPVFEGLLVTELEFDQSFGDKPHLLSQPKPNETEIPNNRHSGNWFFGLETYYHRPEQTGVSQWIKSRIKAFKTVDGFYNGANFRLWIEPEGRGPLDVQFGINGTELVPSYVFEDIAQTSQAESAHLYLRANGIVTRVQYRFDRENLEETHLYSFQAALLGATFNEEYPVDAVMFFKSGIKDYESGTNTVFQILTDDEIVPNAVGGPTSKISPGKAVPILFGSLPPSLKLDLNEVPAVKMYFFIRRSIYILFISDRLELRRPVKKKAKSKAKANLTQPLIVEIAPKTREKVHSLRVCRIDGDSSTTPGIPLNNLGLQYEDQLRDDLFQNYSSIEITFRTEEECKWFILDFNEHLAKWNTRCQNLEASKSQSQSSNIVTRGLIKSNYGELNRTLDSARFS